MSMFILSILAEQKLNIYGKEKKICGVFLKLDVLTIYFKII